MSNFLNNLVARTLNLAPVVQPRLTSRFEPVVPTVTSIAPDEAVEVEAMPEPVFTTPLEPRASIVAPLTPQSDRDRPREDVRPVINTIRQDRIQSHEDVQRRIEPIQNTLLVPPPQNFSTHESERLPASEPPSRPVPGVKTEQVVSSRDVDPATQKPVAESDNWRQLQPRVQSLIESRLSAVQLAAANDRVLEKSPGTVAPANITRSIARNEVAPFVPAPRVEPRIAFQPEPAETINVTIGRVDVRAVFSQQAAASPARARTSPVNSLDDYLKQRSEGRR